MDYGEFIAEIRRKMLNKCAGVREGTQGTCFMHTLSVTWYFKVSKEEVMCFH